MKVKEEGHVYELSSLDGEAGVVITFVNREGTNDHPGVQTQEVLRVLIDRTMHCDNCLRWEGNDLIIYHLRMALVLHEARALIRKVQKGLILPERMKLGQDGHFLLEVKGIETNDALDYQRKGRRDSPLREDMGKP